MTDSPSAARVSTNRKVETVLRHLRGQDIQTLAAELHVSTDRLARWVKRYMDGGRAALATPTPHHRQGKWTKHLWQWSAVTVALFILVWILIRYFTGSEPSPP